ncbi:diguanylate cyclase response regulator [candidate division KSB1 bacterium]|nr:MAG: diguanylate cyclase response regulator [candidate division KSB1 bacterium]
MEIPTKKEAKILVVDDIAINLELQKAYLTAAGYEVIEAKSGQEALQKVRDEKPDLILLDVMMPKMSGYEVCKILKNDPETQFIPIIMVTALTSVEDKIRGIEAGADDFISRPFNKTELMARVKSLLRIKFLQDQLHQRMQELSEARERLQQLAITDGLTGLFNYRYFREQLEHEINRAERHNLNVSLVMMDIDFFKYYNDRNGHLAGDEVLKHIANILCSNVRKIDIAARYGGEEFALILPETDKNSAVIVAEKIRKLIEDDPIPHEERQPNGKLTISMGVSNFPDDSRTAKGLIEIADRRLYNAKQAGRNVVIAE